MSAGVKDAITSVGSAAIWSVVRMPLACVVVRAGTDVVVSV